MKKEQTNQKTKDQLFWEEFIVKNNIKKKTSGFSSERSKLIFKETPSTKEIVSLPYSKPRQNPGAKDISIVHHPQIEIDVEKNKLKRIKSGKIKIEGTLDLHGLSLKEAEVRLQLFVGESFQLNKRFLLIITGKGRNSKQDTYGKTLTIKSEINNWISKEFYRNKVQYISKALDKHGGGGAYYFFLIKSKNVFS